LQKEFQEICPDTCKERNKMSGSKKIEQSLRGFLNSNTELSKLKKLVRNLPRDSQILDIGCGVGRKMQRLSQLGFENTLGVDINRATVEICRGNGLNVIHTTDFKRKYSRKKFDMLLFSHIIEHFSHHDLKKFLESYFPYARTGAQVIITTPTMGATFYNNFDHVRPYMPQAIAGVFTKSTNEVPLSSDYCLELRNIYFRRGPLRLFFPYRGHFLNRRNFFIDGINVLLALLFWASFSLIGSRTGWLGLYEISKVKG